MARVTLTDRSLPKLAVPERGRVTYFDAGVAGFGLRVTANAARSWDRSVSAPAAQSAA